MKVGKKIIEVTTFPVLKKYTLSLLILSSFRIDRFSVAFPIPRQAWAMKLKDFKSFFPKVASFLLYKKLFSDTGIVPKDFQLFLPTKTFYHYLTPELKQLKDYVVVYNLGSVLSRRDLASFFHSIEALERGLKQKKFKVET